MVSLALPPIAENASQAEKLAWFQQCFRPHFDEWVLGPIDRLVYSRDALVGFIMMTCAIDYLASFFWGKSTKCEGRKAYIAFINRFFPENRYDAVGLYESLRNGLVHLFTIQGKKYALVHNAPHLHLQTDHEGRTLLNASDFRDDLLVAKDRYFGEVEASVGAGNEGGLLDNLVDRYLRDGFLGAGPVRLR